MKEMDWTKWLQLYGHTLTADGLDRRILELEDQFYRPVGKCPKAGHRFEGTDELLTKLSEIAVRIVGSNVVPEGKKPGVVVRGEFVTDNRFFAVSLLFHCNEEDGLITAKLCGNEIAKVVDLDQQAKMFLN